jgi:hypothetical protein
MAIGLAYGLGARPFCLRLISVFRLAGPMKCRGVIILGEVPNFSFVRLAAIHLASIYLALHALGGPTIQIITTPLIIGA